MSSRPADLVRPVPFAILLGAALASMLIAIALGAARIPITEVVRLLGLAVSGGELPRADRAAYAIVWEIRAPRVLLAALLGAGLAIAGVISQALVRNPLADPFILGISSGASVGASFVATSGALAAYGISGSALAAFVTALLASALVYLLGRTPGGGIDPVRLVLTGVVLAFAFQGVAGTIVFFDPIGDAARSLTFWLLGGLGGGRWSILPLVTGTVMVCGAVAWKLSGALDVLAQGDDAATSLGLDPARTRLQLFALVVAITSVLVAVAGTVGFVGLVVPHAVRLLVGPRHRRVLILAPLLGALLMIWVDLVSRLLVAPRELPLGIVSALIGVPVFIHLLRRRGALLGSPA